jgi:uncharacterized protein (DUF302 family)
MNTETTSGGYGFGATVAAPFATAVARATAALKDEGFGVLTTIDVQATMRDKLGVAFEPYVILGACNPELAHRALLAEPDLGLLLPCNVIVRGHGETSSVKIVDPILMLGVAPGNDELASVATEAEARLRRVVVALAADPEPEEATQ